MDSALRRHFLAQLEQEMSHAETGVGELFRNYQYGPKRWLLFRINWRWPRLGPARVEQPVPGIEFFRCCAEPKWVAGG